MSGKNMKYIKKRKFTLALLILSTLGISLTLVQQAYAVQIIPGRLVIPSDKKVATFRIRNETKDVMTYRFSWNQIAMTKDGTVINVDKQGADLVPDYRPIGKMLRFSPRRTTLKPGEMQSIKFLVRRTKDATEGEYRSHFLVAPERDVEETKEKAEKAKAKSDITGNPIMGVSILAGRSVPIYLLHGETNSEITLENLKIIENERTKNKETSTPYFVSFDMKRTGNRSVFGTASLFCTDKSGEEFKMPNVGKTVSIYAEADTRYQRLPMPELPEGGCSPLRIKIKGENNSADKGRVLVDMIVPQ